MRFFTRIGIPIAVMAMSLGSTEARTTTAASNGGTVGAACVVNRSAFLTVRDLGPFTHFVTHTLHKSPFGAHVRPGTHSPLVFQFRIARLKGFLNDIALHGRYRDENNRLARSLGYRVGKWPLVPLVGAIVRDNPKAILEVYQENWSWRSLNGAKAYMRSVRGSLALLGSNVTPIPSHLGDASILAYVQPSIKDGLHEWQISLNVRVGTTTLKLAIDGGKDIEPGTALALMQKIMVDSSHACSVGSRNRTHWRERARPAPGTKRLLRLGFRKDTYTDAYARDRCS